MFYDQRRLKIPQLSAYLTFVTPSSGQRNRCDIKALGREDAKLSNEHRPGPLS